MSLAKTGSTTLYSESLLRPLRKLDRLVFYAWQRLYQSHAIWHVFVLGGALCHFVAAVRLF